MQQESSEENWMEEQYHREINAQHEQFEREYIHYRDSSLTTLWGAFQDSATAVAHLYRERSSNSFPNTGALWLPFQTAAGTVTTLYKDSCDGIKRTSESALHCGYQRRTRDLADWARSKKRRMIRREDLLAYLAGKPLSASQHSNRRSPKPENASPICSPVVTHPPTSTYPLSPVGTNEPGSDLHAFKEVLRPRGPELFAFVANEIARHCKRPASPIDDKMDVCHYNNKRQRFM